MNTKVYVDGGILMMTPFFKYEDGGALYETPPDGAKEAYICVDNSLADSTVDYFMQNTEKKIICIERALDSTKKFNLKNRMQDKFFAF